LFWLFNFRYGAFSYHGSCVGITNLDHDVATDIPVHRFTLAGSMPEANHVGCAISVHVMDCHGHRLGKLAPAVSLLPEELPPEIKRSKKTRFQSSLVHSLWSAVIAAIDEKITATITVQIADS